jgi:hypothetical protein
VSAITAAPMIQDVPILSKYWQRGDQP